MSVRAIVSGALHKAEECTSKAGKQFAALTLRENVNGSTRWWRAVAFDAASIAAVLSVRVGEPIAVSGEINAEIWTPEDGREPRLSWKITADAVLTARRRMSNSADRHMGQAQSRIEEIIIGPRRRRAMCDLATLTHSIEEFGLLHPIVIRPDGALIAGVRRLAASDVQL